MSIYPLFLPGWDDSSTWGFDIDSLYALLTRNGVSDDGGPEICVTPAHGYPVISQPAALALTISKCTGVAADVVFTAMNEGMALVERATVRSGLAAGETNSPFSESDISPQQNVGGKPAWHDLAANTAGRQVAAAANQARRDDGAGADRS
jgi:hypothetical protein